MKNDPIRRNKLFQRIFSDKGSNIFEKNLYVYIKMCFEISYYTGESFLNCAKIMAEDYDGCYWCYYDRFTYEIVERQVNKYNLNKIKNINRTPNFYVKTEKIFELVSNNCDDENLKTKFFEEVKSGLKINDIVNKYVANC